MLELSTKISGDRLTAEEWANHSKELENVVTKNDLPLGNEQENLYNAILRMGKKSGIIKIYKPDIIDDDDNEESWFVINDPELTDINKLEVGDTFYIDFSNGINMKYFTSLELQIGDGDRIPFHSLGYIHGRPDILIGKTIVDFSTPLLVTKKDDYFLINNFLKASHTITVREHDDIADIVSVDDTFMDDLEYDFYSSRMDIGFNMGYISVEFYLTITGNDTLIKDNIIKGKEKYKTHRVIEDYFNTGKNYSQSNSYQYGFYPTISYTFEYIDDDDSDNNYTFPEILATGYDAKGLTNDELNTKLLELDGTKDRYNKLTIKSTIIYVGETLLFDKKD
jgi:hypothetical protein